MYEQVEKPKETKSRAVANSVGQKKSNVKQDFGFVDNRQEMINQLSIQRIINTQQARIQTNSSEPRKRNPSKKSSFHNSRNNLQFYFNHNVSTSLIQMVSEDHFTGKTLMQFHFLRKEILKNRHGVDDDTLRSIINNTGYTEMVEILSWPREYISSLDWTANLYKILKSPGKYAPSKSAPRETEGVNYETVTVGHEIELSGVTLRYLDGQKLRGDKKASAVKRKTDGETMLYITHDAIQNPEEDVESGSKYPHGKFYMVELVTTPTQVNDNPGLKNRSEAVHIITRVLKNVSESNAEKKSDWITLGDISDLTDFENVLVPESQNPTIWPGMSWENLGIQATYGFSEDVLAANISTSDENHSHYMQLIHATWEKLKESTSGEESSPQVASEQIASPSHIALLYQAIRNVLRIQGSGNRGDKNAFGAYNYIENNELGSKSKSQIAIGMKGVFTKSTNKNAIKVLPKNTIVPKDAVAPSGEANVRLHELLSDVSVNFCLHDLATSGEIKDRIQGSKIALYEIRNEEDIPSEHRDLFLVPLDELLGDRTMSLTLAKLILKNKFSEGPSNKMILTAFASMMNDKRLRKKREEAKAAKK